MQVSLTLLYWQIDQERTILELSQIEDQSTIDYRFM